MCSVFTLLSSADKATSFPLTCAPSQVFFIAENVPRLDKGYVSRIDYRNFFRAIACTTALRMYAYARSLRARILWLLYFKHSVPFVLFRTLFIVLPEGDVSEQSFPLVQGEFALLPSVNGRSLRHVLVRQISALV